MKIFFKRITSLQGRRPWQSIIIFFIFIVAFLLRIFGLNWDDNNHLHPDERFLTMVVTDIKLPSSISNYFDSETSPLNPYNYSQYQFFVYGTFPLFLVKTFAVFLHLDNYNQIALLGRVLSALFDSANIILLYFIARKLFKNFYVYLPSIFYSLLVLPLQLSHFFTVDTFLTFFLLLTFTLCAYDLFFLAFFAFGLALACKISALYFLPIILLLIVYQKKKLSLILVSSFWFLVSALSFRLFQPYAFIDFITPNPDFINSLKTLTTYSGADIYYPPGVQWINRLPLLNSVTNIFLWGLGLPLATLIILEIIIFLKKPKFKFNLIFILCSWILLLYLFQGSQFSHSMRYFLPIYPFLSIISLYPFIYFKVSFKLVLITILFTFLSALAFLSIYSRPHSRVQATQWINNNISVDKILSSEYWDDSLPLGYSSFKSITLPLFDPDTEDKWSNINQNLNQIDCLIMSSNRLWASIPRVPEKYPVSSLFYKNLFAENLNFSKIKEFNSYPGFSLSFLKSCYYFGPTNYPGVNNTWFSVDKNCSYPGLYFRDDTAEEAFTVYDHPKVLIFQKK